MGTEISAMELKSKICTKFAPKVEGFEFSNQAFLLSILHKIMKAKQP